MTYDIKQFNVSTFTKCDPGYYFKIRMLNTNTTCVRACVRAWMRAYVCAYVHVCIYIRGDPTVF